MPAAQATREAARRLQCGNNLKQLALATAVYAETFGTFPMALHWQYCPTGAPDCFAGRPSVENSFGPLVTLLPFYEQGSPFNAWNTQLPMGTDVNATVCGTAIGTLWCPSDGAVARPEAQNTGTAGGRRDTTGGDTRP